MLVWIPVSAWDALADKSAYQVVGLVKSSNHLGDLDKASGVDLKKPEDESIIHIEQKAKESPKGDLYYAEKNLRFL